MLPRRSAVRVVLLGALAGMLVGATPTAALTANEPALADQWGMELIGAPKAWAADALGSGVTIAVIDSGVDLGHEDLAANLVPGRNELAPNSPPQDDNGHGTHVAGIAAGVTGNGRGITGVAPAAKILPLRVLQNGKHPVTQEDTAVGSSDDVNRAIRFAADAGAKVINLSLGADVNFDMLDLDGFVAAIDYAWAKGSVVVVAAGNSSLPLSGYNRLQAIVVTSVDRRDRSPGYANGVGTARWGMAAPGGAGRDEPKDNVLSTYFRSGTPNAYAYMAGTSMATPHVSGAAAVLRALGLSAQQTVDRLLATAKDLGTPGPDTTYGAGRLDLAKAIEGLTKPPASGAGGGPATTAATPSTPTTVRTSTTTTRPRPTAPATAPAGSPAPASSNPTPETTATVEQAAATTTPDTPPTTGPARLAEVTASGAEPKPSGADVPGAMLAFAVLSVSAAGVLAGLAFRRRLPPQ